MISNKFALLMACDVTYANEAMGNVADNRHAQFSMPSKQSINILE